MSSSKNLSRIQMCWSADGTKLTRSVRLLDHLGDVIPPHSVDGDAIDG